MRIHPIPLLMSLVASGSQAEPATPRHVISVTLDPASGTLAGTDTLTIPYRRSVDVRLHPDLEVAATCGGGELRPVRDGDTVTLALPGSCRDRDGLAMLEVRLSGRILDPVKDEPSLHFVTGDHTSGLITEEGAFLAGGTGWYPETGDLATYDASVTVPAGWSVVSQGDGHAPTEAEGGARTFRWTSAIPTDGLAMSAGPYVVDSVEHEGITISTWLWEEDRALAPVFLDAARKEITRLTCLLGPYPGTKFAIVENFFTTGYGFPTYTLLGRDVIRMGPRALRPGYLDHEIAHVWFGNYVNVDLKSGNWCEGLTSYVTNYLNTAAAGEAEALDARRRVSQRYSVDVPPDKDSPPAAFVTKTDDIGASIGYGKVAMVFHVLERMLGPDTTWAALRDFVKTRGGKRASWADVEASFERASGRDLGTFFDQWIDAPGLPRLSLSGVRDDVGRVTGTIAQDGRVYRLPLDVEVTLVDGTTLSRTVELEAASTPFTFDVPGRVHRVTLDPQFHVPRRLEPEELPPSLARTLAGPLLVVHPDAPPEDADPSIRELHDKVLDFARMAAGENGTLMPAKVAAQADLDAGPVFLVGSPQDNRWVAQSAKLFLETANVDLSLPYSFRAGDRRWRDFGDALLVSAPNPGKPGATITAWIPNGPAAIDHARMAFYYGWDTWAALSGGRAAARGTTWPQRGRGSVVLAELEAPGTAAGRMRATIASLLAPELEGRESGLRASMAGSRLATELAGIPVEPFGEGGGWTIPFRFVVRDLPGIPGFAWMPEGSSRLESVDILPATGWLPLDEREKVAATLAIPAAAARFPMVIKLPRGVVSAGGPKPRFTGLDLEGAAAVVVDDGTPGAVERILGWIDEARRRNAEALIVVRPDAEWPGEPGLTIAASLPDPKRRPRMEKLVEEQGRRAALRVSSGDQARAEPLPRNADFPLFFGGPRLAATLKGAGGLSTGARSFAGMNADLRLSFTLEDFVDHDVVARIPGRHGAIEPVVVLSAHHDGLGELPDGRFQEAAADNAAGAAVVVEVARRLAAVPATRPVVIALLSGEEWGLRGSRELARRWQADRLPAISAVVNVDSVGHAGAKLHVIGRTREPALASVLDDAARAAGLETGGSIDEHGDRDGSDHWPWVAKGIPAVSVFQADYRTINSPADTAEKLDDATLEKLADALEAAVRRLATP